MENKKIILCRGIQGSGKSTYAKAWAKEDPEHRVRFNNDDFRNMMGQYWVPSREYLIAYIKEEFLYRAMQFGYDIIIDNMNLNPKEVKFYEDLVEKWNNPKGVVPDAVRDQYKIEFKNFFISVDECIRRDAMRPNPIGEKVIRDTWNKYKQFIQTESINKYVNKQLKQDLSKPKAIVLDMDNTLCFNTTGRPWYGKGSAEGMLNDFPNKSIIELARIYDNNGYNVIIITGRDKSAASSTKQWLRIYGVPYDFILYREEQDFRKSAEIKKELITTLLKDYNIEFIIDDADPVVEMYREMGLTVLQPNKSI